MPPNRTGLDPPNIKISDSGGLDLEAWCLDVWMLAGMEGIGGGDGGDGGDGILGRGDWKKLPQARASGARRIFTFPFYGGSFCLGRFMDQLVHVVNSRQFK